MNHNDVYEEFDEDTFLVDLKDNENKKMKEIKKFLVWFGTSSVDRNKFALTLKSGIPFLVLMGISDTDTLHSLAGSLGDVLVSYGEFVTGVLTVFGLYRKIYLSIK